MSRDWPGSESVSLDSAAERWGHGIPRLLLRGGDEVQVLRAQPKHPGGILWLRTDCVPSDVAWSGLDVVGSTREMWGEHAGRYMCRVLIETTAGWMAVVLRPDDPETLAARVLRDLSSMGPTPCPQQLYLMVIGPLAWVERGARNTYLVEDARTREHGQ